MKIFTLTLFLAAVVTARADQAEQTKVKFSPALPIAAPSVLEKLNLNDDQQAKVAELKKQYAAEYLEVSKKVSEANQPIALEYSKLKLGENEARRQELMKQLVENRRPLAALNDQYRAKFTELLTQEQKTKYTALEAEAKLPQLVFSVVLDSLGLSAEQATKYQALLKEYRGEMLKLVERRKKDAEALQAAAKEGNKEKLAEIQNQRTEVTRAETNIRERYLEQFKALLTDEQKAKFQQTSRSTPRPLTKIQ